MINSQSDPLDLVLGKPFLGAVTLDEVERIRI
jgi:hypothetical protein